MCSSSLALESTWRRLLDPPRNSAHRGCISGSRMFTPLFWGAPSPLGMLHLPLHPVDCLLKRVGTGVPQAPADQCDSTGSVGGLRRFLGPKRRSSLLSLFPAPAFGETSPRRLWSQSSARPPPRLPPSSPTCAAGSPPPQPEGARRATLARGHAQHNLVLVEAAGSRSSLENASVCFL